MADLRLHIQLLGDFRVRTDAALVEGINSARAQAFLAYLLLHRDAPQARQSLAFRLYPESTEKQARTNLRQLIHLLRQALPDADRFLEADGQSLQWRSAAPFTLDVLEFETAAAQADTPAHLRAAAELYHGELLPACYDDWVLAEREQLRQRYVEVLERLIRLLTESRTYRSAIYYAELLLRQDSLNEETYQLLMRLHAARGDSAGVVRVYQMCVAVLQRELGVEVSPATRAAYQALRAAGSDEPEHAELVLPGREHNLPFQLNRFLGREREVAEIRRLLQPGSSSGARLLTLTGVGGCGKTRLALQVAGGLIGEGGEPPAYPEGVWLAELAPLTEGGQVTATVAAALEVREQPGVALLTTLTTHLQNKTALLLLDNCEHLLDACAQLAETLLQRCPRLQILATSRERLNIAGEQAWPVPTLSLPTAEDEQAVAELQRSEAVQLFVERAAAVLPTFHLNAGNLAPVARICRQLDGLPLAIELAAARVKLLPVAQMAERLTERDRFHLLTGGSRTAAPRQQTLRGLVDWSYCLLSEPERTLFRRLAVFAGGWTIEAAEQVCGDGPAGAAQVLEVMAHLMDKSLVSQENGTGLPRYRYLETIRQYANEKLQEAGELEPVLRRHLDFYRQLAEHLEPKVLGSEQLAAIERLDSEHDNLRTALDWATRSGEARAGLRLCGALWAYWGIRSHWSEAIESVEALLARPEAQGRTAERARALGVTGVLNGAMGKWELSEERFTEGIALAREVGPAGRWCLSEMLVYRAYLWVQRSVDAAADMAQEAFEIARDRRDDFLAGVALNDLGLVALQRGDLDLARRLFEESVAVGRAVGNPWSASGPLGNLGMVLTQQGDYVQARALLAEAASIHRQFGDKFNLSLELANLARACWLDGDPPSARTGWLESLALNRELGFKARVAEVLCHLGAVALRQDDEAAAEEWLQESLALSRELGDAGLAVNVLAGLAALAARRNDLRNAVRLSAAAAGLRPAAGFEWLPGLDQCMAEAETAGRAGLPEAEFEAKWEAGHQMPLTQVLSILPVRKREEEPRDL